MADIKRSLSELQALYADNASGDISPNDLRDGIKSLYGSNKTTSAVVSQSLTANDVFVTCNTTTSAINLVVPGANDSDGSGDTFASRYFIVYNEGPNNVTLSGAFTTTITPTKTITIISNGSSWIELTATADPISIPSSAIWDSAASTLSATSANWNSVYSTVNANSAGWEGTESTLNSSSANWNRVYTTVNTTSANWSSVYSTVNTNSANWNDTRSTVSSNSAGWEGTESTLNSSSANWNRVYTTVNTTSANWSSVYSTVNTNSAGWEGAEATLNSNSANWNSTRTTVLNNSANWSSVYSTVNASSSDWTNAITSAEADLRYLKLDASNDPLTSDLTINGVMKSSAIDLAPTSATLPWAEGRMYYSSAAHTFVAYNDKSDVANNIGEEVWKRCINKTGAPISNGAVVYIAGATGDKPKISLADANTAYEVQRVLGVATMDIPDNEEGYVTIIGNVNGLDTSTWPIGTILYLSETPGQLTSAAPAQPATTVCVGIVTRSNAGNGIICVRPQIKYETAFKQINGQDSGFDDPTTVYQSYDYLNRIITTSGTGKLYWQGNLIWDLAVNGNIVSTAHDATTGSWYYYYNGTSFVWSDTIWSFKDAQIAEILYDAVIPANSFAVRECHTLMDPYSHEEFHRTLGTYRKSGGSVTTNSYVLNTTTAGSKRPGVDATVLMDEDLQTTLSVLSSASTYKLMHSTATSSIFATSAEIVPIGGTGTPQWDNNGTLTNTTNNQYMNVWLLAIPVTMDTNSQSFRFIWVTGQNASTTLSTINNEASNSVRLGSLGGGKAQEYIFLARVLLRATTNNWTIVSVNNLTGTRVSQTSISGTYLSSVNTTTPISGLGTADSPIGLESTYFSRWNSVASTVSANSAGWEGAEATLNSTSSNWNRVYTTVNTTSANWSSVYSTVNTNSANWNDTRATLSSNSAGWEGAEATLNSNSANWNDTRATLSASSADWVNAITSAEADARYLKLTDANTTNWNSVYTTVNTNSAGWEGAESTLNSSSANWNSVYTTVNTTSANWSSVYSSVNANSANWNDTRATLSASSADWVNAITSAEANAKYVPYTGATTSVNLGSYNISATDLVILGNTTLGNANTDTVTIASSAITLSNIPAGIITSAGFIGLDSNNKVVKQYPIANINTWTTSTVYTSGQTVSYNSSIFRAATAHTSTSAFNADLTYWQSIDANVIIVNKASHSFVDLTPIHYNGTTWVASNASSPSDCATHVVLGSNTNYFLAAETGRYTITSHGKTTSAIYYANGGASSTTPTSYQNAIFQVLDANTIEVISHLPVVYYDTLQQPNPTTYTITGSVTGTGSLQDMITGLDGDTYPWFTLILNVKNTNTTASTSYEIYLNDDNAANYLTQYVIANGTTVGGSSAATSFFGTFYNGVINQPILSRIEFNAASGGRRSSIIDTTTINPSPYMPLRRMQSSVWSNTTDNITKISCKIPNGNVMYYKLTMTK